VQLDGSSNRWIIKKSRNDVFYDLRLSPNIIRVDQIKEKEMGGTCVMYGGDEGFM
jgi:hypothetical protein